MKFFLSIFRMLGTASRDLYLELIAKEQDSKWPIYYARLQAIEKEYVSTHLNFYKSILL